MFDLVRNKTGMFWSWFICFFLSSNGKGDGAKQSIRATQPAENGRTDEEYRPAGAAEQPAGNGGTAGENLPTETAQSSGKGETTEDRPAGAAEQPAGNGGTAGENLPTETAQSSGNGETTEEDRHAGVDEQIFEKDETNKRTKSKTQPYRIGARRGEAAPQPDPSNPKCPSFFRPRLICRKSSTYRGHWEVFLSAHEGCKLKRAHFENRNQKLEINQNECYISSLCGNLIVEYGDENEYGLSIPLFENDKPLIFKFGKNWKGNGQRVFRITNGYFILIAPKKWKREGHVPVEPGNCNDLAFKVHFLNTTIPNEDFGSLGEWKISVLGSAIKLSGENVFDDSEEGDLFTRCVPKLETSQEILWARIGEERKHGWKGKNFEPHKKSISEVLGDRKGRGRFFLRVYDHNVDIIDSVAFRYLDKLERIDIDKEKYTEDMVLLPPSDGYLLTEIRFIGIGDKTMRPHLPNNSICRVTSSNILEVPPNQKADTVKCFLDSSSGKVNITLKLPRVWWQMKKPEDTKSNEWCSTPFIMTQEQFKQHAMKKTKICLSSEKFKSVPVGFDNDSNCKKYKPSEIPLKDFIDHSEINDELKVDAHLNIGWGGKVLPIICVRPNPAEQHEATNRRKKNKIRRPKPNYKIKAYVKCTRHGWCKNRGFSSGEIRKAGFTVEEAENQSIRVSYRRKSVHLINIEAIRKELNVQRN